VYYFFEVNRGHQLSGALALPLAVLTVLGGTSPVIAKDFQVLLFDLK
jgi:hypothetical protein